MLKDRCYAEEHRGIRREPRRLQKRKPIQFTPPSFAHSSLEAFFIIITSRFSAKNSAALCVTEPNNSIIYCVFMLFLNSETLVSL